MKEVKRTIRPRCTRARLPSFTLLEILVVLFILSILALLAVGMANYIYDEAARRQTQATQRVVASIIDEFHETFGKYPADQVDPLGPPGSYDADTSVQILLTYLTGDLDQPKDYEYLTGQASGGAGFDAINARIKSITLEKLLTLSQDAYDGGGAVKDAYGKAMRYEVDGGLGGRPVLISAGEDGEFGDTVAAKKEDNIRSDEH